MLNVKCIQFFERPNEVTRPILRLFRIMETKLNENKEKHISEPTSTTTTTAQHFNRISLSPLVFLFDSAKQQQPYRSTKHSDENEKTSGAIRSA